MQKLTSKSKFARDAGVNPSTITRLSETVLKAAIVGKQIDAAHPDAVKYMLFRVRVQTPPAATGLDNLYEDAIAACQRSGRYTVGFLEKDLKIGNVRAKALFEIMRINGLIPVKHSVPDNPKPAPPPPHVRGHNAAKETRKRETRTDNQILEIPENIEEFAEMTLREILERFGTDTRFVDYLSATQKIEAINEKRLKNAQTKGVLISRELVRVGVIDTFNSAHLRLMKDGSKSIAAGVVSKHVSGAELPEIEAFISDILTSFIKPIKSKINRVLKDA